jgi:hypothetical protein
VSAVESTHTVYRVVGQSGVDIRPLLFKFAVDKSAAIIEMYAEKSSVEDVFRQFTKREAEV